MLNRDKATKAFSAVRLLLGLFKLIRENVPNVAREICDNNYSISAKKMEPIAIATVFLGL